MLEGRFEYEKHKLEAKCGIKENLFLSENPVACCVFCPEILCMKAGFGSWQETCSIIDSTSLFLDMELLQELSLVVLVDAEELQEVRSVIFFFSCYSVTWLSDESSNLEVPPCQF